MKAFAEVQLDVGYDYGVTGGPGFDTDIVEFGPGHESRNALSELPRGEWELGERNLNRQALQDIKAFFWARHGRLQGFRFKDWQDFEADAEPLAPDGTPTVQLRKTYTSGGESVVREIKKPIASTVTLMRNGSSEAFDSVDDTTGVLTLTPDLDLDIDAITASAPAEVTTSTAHGLSTGAEVWITGTAHESLNDQLWTVTRIDDTTISLDSSDTSGDSASGVGSVQQYADDSDTLTWSGEFDVPVRFATDRFQARFEATDDREYIYRLSTLPVKEIIP